MVYKLKTYGLAPVNMVFRPLPILQFSTNFSKNLNTSLFPLKSLCINGFAEGGIFFIPPSYLPQTIPIRAQRRNLLEKST